MKGHGGGRFWDWGGKKTPLFFLGYNNNFFNALSIDWLTNWHVPQDSIRWCERGELEVKVRFSALKATIRRFLLRVFHRKDVVGREFPIVLRFLTAL